MEGTRDVMSWGEMDAAYALAKAKGFPVKLRTLVWGSQQPNWIASLPEAEQREEIQEWFQAAAARYPALDQIEVVNEPLLQNWKILSGSGEGIFAVDPATGSISIAKPLDIDLTRTSYEIVVSVSDGLKSSEPQTVTITIPGKIDVVHNGHAINIAKKAVPAHLREHGDCLGTVGIR